MSLSVVQQVGHMSCERDSGVPEWLRDNVALQLRRLYEQETAPFQVIISDYKELLQAYRVLEVRVAQLDKEAAELRDENSDLRLKNSRVDERVSLEFVARADGYKVDLMKAREELTSMLREKAKLLEELMGVKNLCSSLRERNTDLSEEVTQLKRELEVARQELVDVRQQLDQEKTTRMVAVQELEASRSVSRDAQEQREALETKCQTLEGMILRMKSNEAQRLDEINKMHEEAMLNARRLEAEAAAAREAAEKMLRRNSSSGASSLRHIMGQPVSPQGGGGVAATPSKSVMSHRGGCCSLSFMRPGHQVATCGVDRTVQSWDLNTLDVVHVLQGLLGSVNDVAFTGDGRRLLGAGSDKSIRVWDVQTGQCRHTLTGHSGSVSSVVASPVDPILAVSSSEDRSLKMWDLNKGYSVKSIPCTKMTSALCMSLDGNVIISGHLDGTVCLWDTRQCRQGHSKPLAELRDHTQAILSIVNTSTDSTVLTCCKDNLLRVWDFRVMSTQRLLKAPSFTPGFIGTPGKAHCRVGMSPDGHYVCAGGADGGVYVWDLQLDSGHKDHVKVLSHHKDQVLATGWSSDNTLMVSCDRAGVVAFWQVGNQ